jgi:hypothetical protein
MIPLPSKGTDEEKARGFNMAFRELEDIGRMRQEGSAENSQDKTLTAFRRHLSQPAHFSRGAL